MRRDWFRHEWHERAQRVHHVSSQLQDIASRISIAKEARQRAEQAVMQVPDAKDVKRTRILEKLSHARSEYTRGLAEYERVLEQKKKLTASLRDITEKKESAQKMLEKERGKTSDWTGQVRSVLAQSRSVLKKIASGTFSDPVGAQVLYNKVDVLIEKMDSGDAQGATHDALKALARPLQEVARLEATLEERMHTLQSLPEVKKPSDAEVKKLTALAERIGSPEPSTDLDSSDVLESAREAELVAERESGAAQAALEQSRRDLAGIERDILREVGSAELASIQESPPDSTNTPKEKEVRLLASRLASLGDTDPLALQES